MNLKSIKSILLILDTFCHNNVWVPIVYDQTFLRIKYHSISFVCNHANRQQFFERLGTQNTLKITFILPKLKDSLILPFPCLPWIRPLANFTFWTLREFYKPLKLDLFPNTCLITHESRYQLFDVFLLFYVLRLATTIFKKSTLFLDASSFNSSSIAFVAWSNLDASSFPLTEDLISNFFLNYELVPTFLRNFFGSG